MYLEMREGQWGERIYLRSEYRDREAAKSVHGHKWDPELKQWCYPVRMSVCLSMRSTFGDRLEIGPNLWAWAKVERLKSDKMRELSAKPDSELELFHQMFPAAWERMSSRTYQRSGAEFMAVAKRAGNFDEPGLGKTLQALAAIVQAGKWNGRHLIICPKTAIYSTWAKQIKHWTGVDAYYMPEGRAARQKMMNAFLQDNDGPRFLVILPHMLQTLMNHYCKKCKAWEGSKSEPWPYGHQEHEKKDIDYRIFKQEWPELFTVEWDSIVADECQGYMLKLRPPQKQRQPQWAVGLQRLRVKPDGLKYPMTGTPFRGKEYNMYGILYWMDPEKYRSFWAWADTYLHVTGDDGRKTVGALRPEMAEAFYQDLDSMALRRTKSEVRSELPKQMPVEHWVQMSGSHEKQYTEFERSGMTAMEDGMLEGMGILSEMTRLRQLSFGPHNIEYDNGRVKLTPLIDKSPKVELLLDMLQERGVTGNADETGDMKYVVASQWTTVLDALEIYLNKKGIKTLKITGSVTGRKRDIAVDDFSSPGGPRVMLINTTAGGVSITLDAYCEEMFVLDETWVHDDQVQLFGRIDNRGNKIATRIYHLIRTEGTIEESIAGGNADQADMQALILDGRRGTENALQLLRSRREAMYA